MNALPEQANVAANQSSPIAAFKLPRWLWWLRELVALTYWGSIVASWFYDVREAIAQSVPALIPLFEYKFLILVGLFLLTWAFKGFPKAFSFIYILIYPIIWLIRIGKVLALNFQATLLFLPTFYSLIKPFKLNVLLLVTTVISFVAIVSSASEVWITIGMVGLGIYLVSHYFRRFHHAFGSSTCSRC